MFILLYDHIAFNARSSINIIQLSQDFNKWYSNDTSETYNVGL